MSGYKKMIRTLDFLQTGRWCLLSAVVFLASLITTPFPAFAQQDDPPEAVQLYNTGANLFGDQQYQLAIDQWTQLLDEYPGYSLRRDTQHYMALAHYNLKQFDKAVRHFTSLRDSLPNIKDFRRSEKTLMYLAFSQYQVGKSAGDAGKESLRQSLKTYEQFFQNFEDSEMTAEALYFQGEAMYELSRVDSSSDMLTEAGNSYKKILDEHPEAEIRKKALFAYGACLEESGDFEQAGKIYTSYVDEFPDDPFSDEVRLRNADTLLQLGISRKNSGDTEAANKLFVLAEAIYQRLTDDPDFPALASARNQRAYCLLHMGQYAKAADIYATIANDHPDFEFVGNAALDAGKYYFTAGNMDMAEKWLSNVVANDAQHKAEATHWLCRIKLENEKFEEAYQLASTALANEPGNHLVNLLMDSADALYGMPNRRAEAIETYEKIAGEHQDHSVAPKALYYAAFGCMTDGRHTDAIKTATQFGKQFPKNEFLPDALEVLGQAALKEKQLDLAKQTFEDLVKQFPDHKRYDWWQTRVGWVSYMQGNYDDSIGWLSQSLSDLGDPASISEAHYVIGSSQYEIKNNMKAIESLEASLQSNPNRSNAPEVLLLTARAYSNLNENDKAVEIVTRLWNDTKDPSAAYWLGEFLYKTGDFGAAAENYGKALEGDPDSDLVPDAMYGLAWAHASNGKTDLALKSFDDLISRFPEHSLVTDALIGRGKARRIAGKFDEAIDDLSRFLESDPGDENRFNGTFERALCQIGLKNWKLAISDLETLESDLPANRELADDVLFELAWAYQENQQADRAISTFKRIADEFKASSHAAEASYHVGQKLYEQEQYDEAIKRYQASLDSKPDQRVGELAAYKLAWCHFKNSNYDESLKAFQLQTSRYPEGDLHAVGLSMVGESHFQMDQHTEAVTAYKIAIPAIEASEVAENVRVLTPIHAAQSANKIKEYQSALEYADIVIENHPDSPFAAEAWYEAGVAHKGLGDRTKAVEAWTAAMKKSLGKTGARARCMIGEDLFEDKKYNDAIKEFKLVIYGYGGKASADDVKPWQAFAAYEAARCNYVQVNETDDEDRRQVLIKNARELFQMLVDNYPNDRLVQDARKQIKVLDSLK